MQRISHAPELVDRRDAPRVDVDGRYTLRLDPCDGRDVIRCALLDHSVTGARLRLPDDVALPEHVRIVIGELAHETRVVWRKGLVIGVDFVDEHDSIL